MTNILDFEDFDPPTNSSPVSTNFNVMFGRVVPPLQQIKLFSPADWEEFTREWAYSKKSLYIKVVKESGGNDMGIDVAGFTDDQGTQGVWDNFQCKHYNKALTPSQVYVEFGKMIWHSFQQQFVPPRKYYFVAPQGCGMSLSRLLRNPNELKNELEANWGKYCEGEITSTQKIKLEGNFKKYFENFDFSIFTSKDPLDLVTEHQQTPFHAVRFGGGLNQRPQPLFPPNSINEKENNYIKKLLGVYEEQIGQAGLTTETLMQHLKWVRHLDKQREYFYCAESLKNFSRDNVPNGTFENLQKEILDGVENLTYVPYPSKLHSMNTIISQAGSLALSANPLISVVHISDKNGICHQLANDDLLDW
ncbi:ABC-three component system protein [Acinetobacter gerneri]|uniref:ABC-three component system protein n=1 Tax=Acinetobacter gerneri TaxID=202952 RepID=UPI003A8B1392